MIEWPEKQRVLCRRAGAEFTPASATSIVGVARNLAFGLLPINGLRHPPSALSAGWYLWAGDKLSADEGFFEPLHISHLEKRCPEVLPYLGLPAGWRFLLANGYEDIWFDEKLFDV